MNSIDLSLIFKALGDPTRVEIIKLLAPGKLCACNLLEKFNITQPTLSYHMKILLEANVIDCEKKSIWNYYSLKNETLQYINTFIEQMVTLNVSTTKDCECQGN